MGLRTSRAYLEAGLLTLWGDDEAEQRFPEEGAVLTLKWKVPKCQSLEESAHDFRCHYLSVSEFAHFQKLCSFLPKPTTTTTTTKPTTPTNTAIQIRRTMETPTNNKPTHNGKNESPQPVRTRTFVIETLRSVPDNYHQQAKTHLSAVEELLGMHDAIFGRASDQNSDFRAGLLAVRQEAHERARETEALAKKAREHADMMDKLVKQYESSS
ncbi:hypothetical protein CcaCcLH18_13542 [Colletotrichum camelliae]|nr:hypothetical protein CcaCcLH18_13542 [Colletotrichum camelliae]